VEGIGILNLKFKIYGILVRNIACREDAAYVEGVLRSEESSVKNML
jgi:hypothetical protein